MSGDEYANEVDAAPIAAAPAARTPARRSPTRDRSPETSAAEMGSAAADLLVRNTERSQDSTSGATSRIQRTAVAPGTASGPAEAPPRIQAAVRPAGGDVVQRDFVDAISAIGSGIASGAKAAGSKIAAGANAIAEGASSLAKKIHRSDFNDLNATQFLVSAGGSIEAINRREEDGVVTYYRTGSVTVGDGERPTITPYPEAIEMPAGWLPTVTHINGMMVKPNEGIGSAIRLQQELENASGDTLIAADVPSVLYTYSAHRGFVTDLAECIWGKLYQDDDATDRQEQIMLDAVANQHRTTISAHSRGTIKTDNAVRNAHKHISNQHLDTAMADPTVHQQAADAAAMVAEQNVQFNLSAAMLKPTYVRLFARQRADEMATADMDAYVQLIYAGNAVQFPSNAVNLRLVVAGSDPVTIGVGKYFRAAIGSKTKMTDVAGGHGFDDNYAATVAELIIADLQAQGGGP